MVWRGAAGAAVLGTTLAAAGSAATPVTPSDGPALYEACRRAAQQMTDRARDSGTMVAMGCARPDGTLVDTRLWATTAPVPPAPVPVGVCVTGPGRPVVGTTLTSVSVTAEAGLRIIYDYQRLGDGGAGHFRGFGALEFLPGDLAPGRGYRWRARGVYPTTDPSAVLRSPDDEQGWSPWCEFSVSADAVDYRGLGDVSVEALTEVGVRPDRTYTVHLTAAQQRDLRAWTDLGPARDRMTLTGVRLTDLLMQLAQSAWIEEETAREDGESPRVSAYRTLLDAISVELGGPAHPRLG
ncbi:hypothetical protein GCM10025331_68380 [Actinoplanes utahensis]|uniref:Secreted protein n=2 Tax=Actinoplanes utahensis TaxID=1869 RepID=A0A0A6UJ78_ACTUT|nr:hypothetical protein MB27_24805 [Actinoplanes utahensis]GIF27088.1 hypothetical protein Aut01nite_00740 [Actinoplanes utahensis]